MNPSNPKHEVLEPIDEKRIKLAKEIFAREMLKRTLPPFECALVALNFDDKLAWEFHKQWINDAYVIKVQRKIIDEEGEDATVPGKVDLSREIWKRIIDKNTKSGDFAKLARVYAEINGYIQSPKKAEKDNNSNELRVVETIVHVDEETWKKSAIANQKKLKNNNE